MLVTGPLENIKRKKVKNFQVRVNLEFHNLERNRQMTQSNYDFSFQFILNIYERHPQIPQMDDLKKSNIFLQHE